MITDPVFGSRILRVTDANTESPLVGRSFGPPSSSEQNVFNSNGTIFYVLGEGLETLFYSFDPQTMTATRIGGDPSAPYGGLILQIREGAFSYTNPNVIYGVKYTGDGAGDPRGIVKYDFSTGELRTILELNPLAPGVTGGVYDVSASADEKLNTCFGGGGGQDTYTLAVVWDTSRGTYKLLDTQALTIRDGTTTVPAVKRPSDLAGFTLHNTRISKDGRYVTLTKGDQTKAVWDTQTNEVSNVSADASGHKVGGYGQMVNHCVAGDGAQWCRRGLDAASLNSTTLLISPPLSPTQYQTDGHLSWNNAQPQTLVPVVTSVYRTAEPSAESPRRAWDDEIIAIRTDGLESAVWRFAHHRSAGAEWSGIPRGNVSPDGRFFLFKSNWERTLGAGRHDVFIVALNGKTYSSRPLKGGEQHVNWTNGVNVSVTGTTLQKIAGWSASAVGQELKDYGYFEFTVSETNTERWVGLNNGNSTLAEDVDYAFKLTTGGNAAIRENGAYRTETPVVTGDVLHISVAADGVTYKKNGATIHRSGVTPTYPLRPNAWLHTDPGTSATVTNAIVYWSPRAFWTNLTNAAVVGNTLQKTGGWSASAVSADQLASAGGYFEFTVSETNTERWVGLNNGTSTQAEEVDYAFKLTTGSNAAVRENGAYRTERAVSTGDVLRITISGGVVTYAKNGTVFYTSTVAPTYPLTANAWLHTEPAVGATVTNAAVVPSQ